MATTSNEQWHSVKAYVETRFRSFAKRWRNVTFDFPIDPCANKNSKDFLIAMTTKSEVCLCFDFKQALREDGHRVCTTCREQVTMERQKVQHESFAGASARCSLLNTRLFNFQSDVGSGMQRLLV